MTGCTEVSMSNAEGQKIAGYSARQPPLQDIRFDLAPKSDDKFLRNIERAQSAVVTIRVRKMFSRALSSGTGFYIDRGGYLLTNEHVIRGAGVIKVRFKSGQDLGAVIIAYDRKHDVALLKTTSADVSPLPIRLDSPRLGEDVFVIGSPLGAAYEATLSRGMITGFRIKRGNKVIQSDADILPGSSGSPLFDSFGNVIGIAVASERFNRAQTNLNFFIPIGEALKALNGTVTGNVLALQSESEKSSGSPSKPRPKAPSPVAKAPPSAPGSRVSPPSAPGPGRHRAFNFSTVPDGRLTGKEIRKLIVLREFSVTSDSMDSPFSYYGRSSQFSYLSFASRGGYRIEETVGGQIVQRGKWRVMKKNLLCMRRTDIDERERCYHAAKNGFNLLLTPPGGDKGLALYGN